MSKGKNAEHNRNKDLWGARPFASWSKNALHKLLARRQERRVLKKQAIQEELNDQV